jgi:ankyrin repeat protein
VLRLLLEYTADIDMKNYFGRTALHRVAENGHEAVVWRLLEYTADVNANTGYGRTGLHGTVQGGHETVVRPRFRTIQFNSIWC